MNKHKFIISSTAILSIIALPLCSYSWGTNNEITQLNRRIAKLEKTSAGIVATTIKTETILRKQILMNKKILETTLPITTTFSPQDIGGPFHIISSNIGKFYLALKELRHIPGGYKAIFSIGNPYFASQSDCTLLIEWMHKGKVISHTYKTAKRIVAGHWNNIKVSIYPATSKDIQQFFVALSFNGSTSLLPDMRRS